MTYAHRFGRIVTLAVMLGMAAPAAAEGLRVGATAGVGRAYGQTYVQFGGRVGYDVGFGLTPEVGATLWSGGTPTFFQISPGITWYLPVPLIRPYVGAFYAHEFLSSGFPDQDGIGGRAGLALLGLGPISVNVGVAYERHLSCSIDCDVWWPEATAGFSF